MSMHQTFVCPVMCRKQYSKVESLRRHYYRIHPEAIPCDSPPEDDMYTHDDVLDEDAQLEVSGTTVDTIDLDEPPNSLKKVSNFALKIQEKYLVPYAVCDTIIQDMKFIVDELRLTYSRLSREHCLQVEGGSPHHDFLHNPELTERLFNDWLPTFRLHKHCTVNLKAVSP